MIWFTSDNHFFHRNVLKYCARPHSSVEDMNEDLIRRYNEVVRPNDICYFLGDFAFCGVERMRAIVSRLNGTKYLVPGNHDASVSRMEKAGFVVLGEQETFYFAGRKFNLSHYPYAPTKWEVFVYKLKNFWGVWKRQKYPALRYLDRRPFNDGRWLLHGHVHNSWRIKGRQINVGVDVWNYRPVSIHEIVAIIKKKESIDADTRI